MISKNYGDWRPIEHIGLVVFILILISGIYFPALLGPFVLDDQLSLRFTTLEAFETFVNRLDLNGLLRERLFSRLTFLLQLGILEHKAPAYFRFINIVIHSFNGLLLLKLILSLQGQIFPNEKRDPVIVYAGVCFFLLHPIQTQAVNYITQRMTLLALFFMLLSLLTYLYLRRTSSTKIVRAGQYLLLFGLIGLAIGSKPTAVVIFPILLALEYLLFSNGQRRYWLIFLFSCSMATVFYALFFAKLNDSPRINALSYAITQLTVWLQYFKLLLVPGGIALDHQVPVWPNIYWLNVLLACLFHAGFLTISWLKRKTNRLLALGIMITYLSFLPDGLLIPLKDVMVEHRMYFAMIGLAMVLISMLSWIQNSTIKKAVFMILMLSLSIATWSRNKDWASAEKLWESNVKAEPESSRAYYQLALLALSKSDTSAALNLLNIADSLNPQHALTLSTKALLAIHEGDHILARKLLKKARSLEPKEAIVYRNLGFLAEQSGRPLLAISHYQTACKLNPYDAEAFIDLGTAHLKSQQPHDALIAFNQALRLSYKNARLYNNLGFTYELQGDLASAKTHYLEALRIDSTYGISKENLLRIEKNSSGL